MKSKGIVCLYCVTPHGYGLEIKRDAEVSHLRSATNTNTSMKIATEELETCVIHALI